MPRLHIPSLSSAVKATDRYAVALERPADAPDDAPDLCAITDGYCLFVVDARDAATMAAKDRKLWHATLNPDAPTTRTPANVQRGVETLLAEARALPTGDTTTVLVPTRMTALVSERYGAKAVTRIFTTAEPTPDAAYAGRLVKERYIRPLCGTSALTGDLPTGVVFRTGPGGEPGSWKPIVVTPTDRPTDVIALLMPMTSDLETVMGEEMPDWTYWYPGTAETMQAIAESEAVPL